ncbi:hypothetical protein ACFQH1_02340 [Lactiplantibacillus daoliensis]|uniref:Integral membrane protein n=1 Tax=Lactiplantibacillus daoliensis TaxID=2559916 RepID=A0ABW1UFR2_9LACO|nr:hypothetical protein [Lactiplantibacillus daoliensis]
MGKGVLGALNGLVVIILSGAAVLALFWPESVQAGQSWVTLFLVISLTPIIFFGLIGLKRWQAHWSVKTYRRCLWGIGLLIVLTQLIVAFSFVDVGRADAFWVRNQAIALAQGQKHWADYFQTYPNNVNLTLLIAVAIKGALQLGVTNPWVFFNIGRFLWIDTGLLAGLVILRHWQRFRPGALGWLLGWLVSVPFYAYALFDYTDAWVLPLVVDVLALGLKFKTYTGWRRWELAMLTWSILALGVALKSNLIVLWVATGLITLVAMFQYQLCPHTGWYWLVGNIVTLGLVFGGMQQLASRQGYHRNSNQALPATSWIAMSLNPQTSGRYNYHDFEVIRKQPTATAKQRRASRLISTRLDQLKIGGLLSHLGKKMRVFYADGAFDSFKLTTQWLKAPRWFRANTQVIQFWLGIVMQSWYLCLLIGSIGSLRQHNNQQLDFGLLALTILGFTIFHVGLWEVEARYALPLLPVLLILACVQWAESLPIGLTRHSRLRLKWTLVFGILISGWDLWHVNMNKALQTTMIMRQGNGSYYQFEAQTILPKQRVIIRLPLNQPSNQLRLSPVTESGRVQLRLAAGTRTLVVGRGSPRQLQYVTYPTTAKPLTISLTNKGKSLIKYAAVKSNYNQLTGKILVKPAWFMQLTVRDQVNDDH